MQNIIQYRQWQRGLAVALLGILLLVIKADQGLPFFIIVAITFQFCFNQRRSWLIYAPLTIVMLNFVMSDHFFSDGLLGGSFLIAVFSLPVEGLIYLYRRISVRRYARQINESGALGQLYISDHLLKQSGLTNAERLFFKREIKSSYQQLVYLQRVKIKASASLKSYNKDLKLINAIFNELLSSPRQILNVSDFLYDHFPDYVAQTKSLLRLKNNVLKVSEDEDKIKEIQTTIKELSELLAADYLIVTADERQLEN